MAKILSLLSGKGGSGKTTVALAMSEVLSESGIKVLLIDCDIATHGATYFFEPRMTNKRELVSFVDLFSTKYEDVIEKGNSLSKGKHPLIISENFTFIPSVTQFPYSYSAFSRKVQLKKTLEATHFAYDIVIFDCQAGYSELLDIIVDASDVNLLIMEPDAISSSAIRVLRSQLKSKLSCDNTYLLLSKITKEENDIYANFTFENHYTVLPSLIFNWEVRKAFAFAKVPDLSSTNAEFGMNIYQIATVIFDDYSTVLIKYKEKVLKLEHESKIYELNEVKQEKKRLRKIQSDRIVSGVFLSVLTAFIIIATTIITITQTNVLSLLLSISKNASPLVLLLAVGVLTCSVLTLLVLNFRRKVDSNDLQKILQKEKLILAELNDQDKTKKTFFRY
ncbi:MAG: ParA family protein [Clostridiaceae bacterium]